MKKKLISTLLCAGMVASLLAGCGNSSEAPAETGAAEDAAQTEEAAPAETETEAEADGASGQVYYLNFKPEVDEVWQKLAEEYTAETGVPVKVVTAASGT